MIWRIAGWLIIFGLPSVHPRSLLDSSLSCPPDAQLSDCAGCWSECPITGKNCTTQCQAGCRCKELDYFLHNGACFPLSQCPYIQADGRCPENMELNFCAQCKHFCPVAGQKCVEKCRTGCVCKCDLLMHAGKCLHKTNCPQVTVFVSSCPKDTQWHMCAPCRSYCFPDSRCVKECVQGCVCNDKDLVFYEGLCMKREDCPSLPSESKT